MMMTKTKVPPITPPKQSAPAAPKDRKCCKTKSGKDVPHAPDCNNNPDAIKARKALQTDSHLPDGTTFIGTYKAETKSWTIQLNATIGGQPYTFQRAGSNHDKLFHQLAAECRAAAAKVAKEAEQVTAGG